MQFLALQANGRTEGDIAAECNVSIWTVKATTSVARSRLGARSTLQAVVQAIALELLCLNGDGVVSVPVHFHPIYNPGGGRREIKMVA